MREKAITEPGRVQQSGRVRCHFADLECLDDHLRTSDHVVPLVKAFSRLFRLGLTNHRLEHEFFSFLNQPALGGRSPSRCTSHPITCSPSWVSLLFTIASPTLNGP